MSITEAVDVYRGLVQASPGVFLSDLATSLNNLSVRQGDVGDRDAALVSITEAVDVYRGLVQASPGAFLPDLASSLNNLSNQQSNAGDRDAALVSILEAVEIRRRLAQVNPGAFLADLATSLNNLADRWEEQGNRESATTTFTSALAVLRPGAASELLVSRARWHHRHGDKDGAIQDLLKAADLIDEEPAWRERSRRAVHAAVIELDEGGTVDSRLPVWARSTPPDPIVAILNRWHGARTWPEREAVLREARDELCGAEGREALEHAAALFPEVTGLVELQNVRAEIEADGFEEALAARRSAAEHAALLIAWLKTPNWTESFHFAREHPDLLTDPRTAAFFDHIESDDAVIGQHRAIVGLTAAGNALSEIYDLLTDPTSAAEAGMRAVDDNDLERVADLFQLRPQLMTVPFAGPYLYAILVAVFGDGDDSATAREAMTRAAGEATAIQRRAGSIRLRRLLARRLEDAAGIGELGAILSGVDDAQLRSE